MIMCLSMYNRTLYRNKDADTSYRTVQSLHASGGVSPANGMSKSYWGTFSYSLRFQR